MKKLGRTYRGTHAGARPPISRLENINPHGDIPNPFEEYDRLNKWCRECLEPKDENIAEQACEILGFVDEK